MFFMTKNISKNIAKSKRHFGLQCEIRTPEHILSTYEN